MKAGLVLVFSAASTCRYIYKLESKCDITPYRQNKHIRKLRPIESQKYRVEGTVEVVLAKLEDRYKLLWQQLEGLPLKMEVRHMRVAKVTMELDHMCKLNMPQSLQHPVTFNNNTSSNATDLQFLSLVA